MSQTRIPQGHVDAVKNYTVKTFARIVQAPGWLKSLTGPMMDGQAESQMKLEGRTVPGMPCVRVADLSKTPGDKVSVVLFDTMNGEPIVGTRNLEGRGEALASSSQEILINQLSKVVDAGAEMDQKRVNYELLPLCEAQLGGYFPRLYNQSALVHCGGGRGSQTGRDWIVPLNGGEVVNTTPGVSANFTDILVNPVLPPTYNRHLVIDGTGFVQGGQQLGSIDSADVWTLDHIDALATMWDEDEFPMQPVRIPDDPAADDDPIRGILWLTPKQLLQITTQNSGRNWTDMVKLAWQRKTYGSKHPLFSGEPGMWKGILIKQLPVRHVLRWLPGETTNIITAANRYTATASSQAVNGSLTAGYAVDRAVFMGAQALGFVWGKSKVSNFWFELRRRKYNFEQSQELAGISYFGLEKLRFSFRDGSGNVEPTDHGIRVIDSAVKV